MENLDDGTERNHMENPDDCTETHQMENMPDRTGGVKGWNFEKSHSILHKVRVLRDILLLG